MFDFDFEFHLDLEHFQADTQALAPSAMPQNQRRKRMILTFLINLGVIVFLLGFIFLYTSIFGIKNSCGAISIATSILMFTQMDMGIKTSHAPFAITMLFLFTAFASHCGVWNPFLGILVNFVSIFLIVTFSCQAITTKIYLPFVVCYIFNQGNPVEGRDFLLRILGLLSGGILVGIVYVITHRKKTYRRGMLSLLREVHPTSLRTRFALRLAFALTLGMFIGDIFHLPRTAWIGMTINSLVLPFLQETRPRFPYRILAQFIGGAVFFVVFGLLLPREYHIIGIFLTSFFYMFAAKYAFQQIFVSINAMIGAYALGSPLEIIGLRIEFVLIGAAIVVLTNLIAIYGKPVDRAKHLWERHRLQKVVHNSHHFPPHQPHAVPLQREKEPVRKS
ncbi:MAG: FUSC family protein [Oscillospiraceae bacterium]|nr:FUSC family protein [Oscillospiraceae bacterium]